LLTTKVLPWIMIAAALGVFAIGSVSSMNRQAAGEIESGVAILNPEGNVGRALHVYHPGVTTFQRRMTFAFARGMASSGWRCDITTASHVAPDDLAPYDLLVLGSQTYYNEPAPSIVRYLDRLGDLDGQPLVLLVTAGTSPEWATWHLENAVREAGGEITLILELLQFTGNETPDDVQPPEDIARHVGSTMAP